MLEKHIAKKKIVLILRNLFKKKGIALGKIVIFGSFTKGLRNENNDIDIIIVSTDFRDKSLFERVELTTGINRELVRKMKKPVDTIFYSDEEWEQGFSLIINTAKKEGEIIFG